MVREKVMLSFSEFLIAINIEYETHSNLSLDKLLLKFSVNDLEGKWLLSREAFDKLSLLLHSGKIASSKDLICLSYALIGELVGEFVLFSSTEELIKTYLGMHGGVFMFRDYSSNPKYILNFNNFYGIGV